MSNNGQYLKDIRISALDRQNMVKVLGEFSKDRRKRTAFYLNAHCVNVAFRDPHYRKILNQADLVYAGGMGVVWASGFLGRAIPGRVNILDFFEELVDMLREKKVTLFLLGGTQEVIKKAQGALTAKGIQVLGSRDGYFDKAQEAEVIREINDLKPDILMVGFGVPKQEKWIRDHREELDVNLCWAVGGVFDLLAGRLSWAPAWMRRSGLEWLYLSFQSPQRFFQRYLFGNPLFVYRVLREKFKKS